MAIIRYRKEVTTFDDIWFKDGEPYHFEDVKSKGGFSSHLQIKPWETQKTLKKLFDMGATEVFVLTDIIIWRYCFSMEDQYLKEEK